MKRLKAGPELKLPDLRLPAFLEDLCYDLKDRRLLPLVALAIVAIVAVPFLLSGGSDKHEPHTAATGGGSASASGAEASLTVVRANPGLREYRKRLGDRTPRDPFKQHFTAPDLVGAALGSPGEGGATGLETPPVSSTTTSSSTSTTIESTGVRETRTTTHNENGVVTTEAETTTNPPSQSPSAGAEGNGGSGQSEPSSLAYTIEMRIKTTKTATEASTESTETEIHSKTVTRPKVAAPTALPGEKNQVVTYMGVSPQTGQPLLLVSDEVTSVFGEAKCLSGAKSCQLLEVEIGMPVTFVFGEAGDTYKMTVLKVEPLGTKES